MEIASVSDEQMRRVEELQKLLATGIDQLLLFYFDMQLHGLAIPGSLNIRCYVCDQFNISTESMLWDSISWDGIVVTTITCNRCEFAVPWPCGNLRSEDLAVGMIFLAELHNG